MKARISGATRLITGGKVQLEGQPRILTRVARHNGSELVSVIMFTSPLSVTVDGRPLGVRIGAGSVTTPVVTSTPNGGKGPYTYLWAKTLGFGVANNPNMAATTFTETVANEESKLGVFSVTVTDSLGAIATTEVFAQFNSLP